MRTPGRAVIIAWILGALAGAGAQVDWLLEHGWEEAPWRLPAGALGGALILWALLTWAWPALKAWCRSFMPALKSLAGLGSRTGRRAWLGLLIVLLLGGSHFAYYDWLRPRLGMDQVREYYLDNTAPQGQGLLTLLYTSLDQASHPKDLGLTGKWDYRDVPQFPGAMKDHYVLRWLGVIKVSESGTYGFGGYADDGLKVFIDGKLVADDYREMGKRLIWGTVDLAAGEHAIDVWYRQVWEGAWLQLLWQPPGSEPLPLDPALLRPLKPGADLAEITRIRLAHGMDPDIFSTYDPFMGGRFWRLPW